MMVGAVDPNGTLRKPLRDLVHQIDCILTDNELTSSAETYPPLPPPPSVKDYFNQDLTGLSLT